MLKLISPAKINLYLQIVGKRPDGYHELSSLFQTIDLSDVLTFEKNDKDKFTCNDAALPNDKKNLVLKALDLFRSKTKFNFCLKVHLEKHIPIEAGLGGGSSNAATTLWACNQLTGNLVSVEKLQEWGSEIGSDIPFFFSTGTALCNGRGEIVQNKDPAPSQTLYIVKPQGGLSTPAVYGRLRIKESRAEKNGYFNDLEQPAFELRPDLRDLKQKLQSGGFDTVLMSGSGSSFFCLGEGEIPHDPSLHIYKSAFLNRTDSNWY